MQRASGWKLQLFAAEFDALVCVYSGSFSFIIYTPCPAKNGTNNVLGITLTKFNKFSQFLAQFMLTYQLTKKL